MPVWDSEAKIAAGNNQAGSLTLVTALTTTPAIPFLEPQTVSMNWRGVRRVSTVGTSRFGGYARCQWKFSRLFVVQRNFLIATYESLNGGQVTIRTTFNGITWANYNAVMYVDELGNYQHEPEVQYGFYLPDFIVSFSRLEAL